MSFINSSILVSIDHCIQEVFALFSWEVWSIKKDALKNFVKFAGVFKKIFINTFFMQHFWWLLLRNTKKFEHFALKDIKLGKLLPLFFPAISIVSPTDVVYYKQF